MSTGETLEQRIIVTSSLSTRIMGQGGGNPVYYAFLYYRVQ